MMNVATLAVILVVIGMAIGGVSIFIADSNNSYGLNMTQTEFKTFDRINKTQALTTDINEQVLSSGITETDSLTTFVKGGFSGAKLLASLPGTFVDITADGFNTVTKYTGIPPVFQSGIIALVGLVLLFGLLYAIFKIKF